MRTAHIGPVVLFAITLNLQSAVQLFAQEAINIIPSSNALTTGVNPRNNLDRQSLQSPKPSPSFATSNRSTDHRQKGTQTEQQESLRPSKPPNKPNQKRLQGKAAQIEQDRSERSRRTNNPSIVPRQDVLPIPTKPAEIAETPANIELSQEKKIAAQLSESYCEAVKPSISEQLMSWQRMRLDQVKVEVEDRLKKLEQKKLNSTLLSVDSKTLTLA
jgi:hypothetical protein